MVEEIVDLASCAPCTGMEQPWEVGLSRVLSVGVGRLEGIELLGRLALEVNSTMWSNHRTSNFEALWQAGFASAAAVLGGGL